MTISETSRIYNDIYSDAIFYDGAIIDTAAIEVGVVRAASSDGGPAIDAAGRAPGGAPRCVACCVLCLRGSDASDDRQSGRNTRKINRTGIGKRESDRRSRYKFQSPHVNILLQAVSADSRDAA
ncbi:hypothetical protein [Roseibium sp.]|uniref:hypothetical protein n=1 Tax=Roseibium sp. TaxID=1936156 RepID=UPI003BABCAC5